MTEIHSSASNPSSSSSKRVILLPYALYEFGGLLFELYDGGQPPRRHQMEWVRLKPSAVAGSAKSESQSE